VSWKLRSTIRTDFATHAVEACGPLPAASLTSNAHSKKASKLAAIEAVRKRPCLGTKRAE
jgi:hypothetical protein